jgi:hypothetical protein
VGFAAQGQSLHPNTFFQAEESHKLKRPFHDLTIHIVFTQQEFIKELAVLVPRLRGHLKRYAGALARYAKIRVHVLVRARLQEEEAKTKAPTAPSSRSKSWAMLFRKVFSIDVESCDECNRGLSQVSNRLS